MLLKEALRLRGKGLAVFPVAKDSKTPLVEWKKYQTELPTVSQVTEWFSQNNRAIGVATGVASRLFLLDLDFKHPEAKEWYEKNKERIPRTWSERTGSGGLHFYFRWGAFFEGYKTNTASEIAIGVDTKGDGGYSKLSPSDGYEWINSPFQVPLASTPQWLIDLLPPKNEVESTDVVVRDSEIIKKLESIIPGDTLNGRNPVYLSVIGALKYKGLKADEVEHFLMPWAIKHDYVGKLKYLVDDQFKRYPPEIIEAELTPPGTFAEFMADQKPSVCLVDEVIEDNTINIIAGLEGSRKSWLLLDLALAIASGGKWMDKFQCTKKKVLVIDQERPKKEMQKRLRGLCKTRGLEFEDLEGNFLPPFVGTTTRLNLDTSFDAFCRRIEMLKPDVLLIDSLKAFQSGELQNQSDAQLLFERVKFLRTNYGLTIFFVHHLTKAEFQRKREGWEVTSETIQGAGAVREVPETLFVCIELDNQSSILYNTKNNVLGGKVAPVSFRVVDVIPKESFKVEAF